MSELLNYSGQLVVSKCFCGMRHAVPVELEEHQNRAHARGERFSIYCPLGHGYIPAGEPESARLRARLAQEIARHDQTRAELRTVEARRRATLGAKTRLVNRVRNGVCIFCQRSFANLAAHMATKHEARNEEEKP